MYYYQNTCHAGEPSVLTVCRGSKEACFVPEMYITAIEHNREKLTTELEALDRAESFLLKQLEGVQNGKEEIKGALRSIDRHLVDIGVDRAVSNVVSMGLRRNGEPRK